MGLLVIIPLLLVLLITIWIFSRIKKPRVFYNPNGNAAPIISQMKSINESYFPTPWLITPDIHTIWGMRYRPSSKMVPVREEIAFPDGGCTQLDWFLPKVIEKNVPVLVVNHTMGGGTREPCSNNICEAATKKGWIAVVANQRGCSGGRTKTARLYDGLHVDDLQNIIKFVKEKYNPTDVFMVGFSMGAYLTAELCNVDPCVTASCCISHTYFPIEASKILEKIPKNRKLYLPIIVAKLKRQVEKNTFIDQEIRDRVKNVKTLSEFDDEFTAKQAGVKDHVEYYERVKLAPKVVTMKNPMLFIGADDDPFTSSKFMPIEECKQSQNCAFVETKEGGHVTFAQGWDGKTTYAEKVALEWFEIAAKVRAQKKE